MEGSVRVSLEDATRTHCVDIFVRADASFGFEAYRKDFDTGIGWCSLGRFSNRRFITGEDTLAEVKRLFAWVNPHEIWRW